MVDPKLYSLLAISETGSFSAAAAKLSLTQPAVSQHIKALESELNVRLFDRASGKLIVTKHGEKVIRYAKKSIGLYNQLTQELSGSISKTEHLNVGITHTAESNPIAEALAKFCAENDGVSITTTTDTINNLYNMLKTYEIDLAVVEGRQKDAGIRYLMLDTDYLVLAVAPGHAFASKSMVTLDDLKKERLILRLPSSGTRNLFVAHLESNNLDIREFDVIMEIDNVATIKDLIRRSFGVSILPKSVCLDELKKKKLVALPVENLSMIREMNIAYRADFDRAELLQGIIRAYNETVQIYK